VKYLIDTNVIFEVRKGRRCDPNVARWYEKIKDASLYLSVLVIGEIRSGIEKVRPKDTAEMAATITAASKYLAFFFVASAVAILAPWPPFLRLEQHAAFFFGKNLKALSWTLVIRQTKMLFDCKVP
jgi:predicted nucleic acid-binding protein